MKNKLIILSSSWNAPGARVEITLTRGTQTYPTTCYLLDAAHDPWLAEIGLPWDQFLNQPRNAQKWKLVNIMPWVAAP